MRARHVVLSTAVMFLLTLTSVAQTKRAHVYKNKTAEPARPHSVQTANTLEAQIDEYLRQSGFPFGKVKANSWFINMPGKQMSNVRVILGASSTSIAVGAVVVSKRNLIVNSDSMYKMMKLSYDLNYARVCIDTDDDLIIMSQLRRNWLSLQEFKNTVELVAAAADRAYGEMRMFVRTP